MSFVIKITIWKHYKPNCHSDFCVCENPRKARGRNICSFLNHNQGRWERREGDWLEIQSTDRRCKNNIFSLGNDVE